MFLIIVDYLQSIISGFNVINYLSMRSILGALTALCLTFVLGPYVIRILNDLSFGENINSDAPNSHTVKTGTPTMGGLLILVTISLSTLLWSDLSNHYVWLVLLTLVLFGVLGFVDDYKKLTVWESDGLSAKAKYFWQSVICLAIAYYLYSRASVPANTEYIVPFFKNVSIDLGFAFILITYVVIVGASNAVNLTDGLDGLAIMPTVLVGGALGIISYLVGHYYFANYLHLPYVPGSGELAVFCASLMGAGIGFLWFNTYPAEVFMGDIGSLSLGAALGVVAVVARHEIVFFIMGGIFVAETLSVVIQVTSFKLTGNRVFKMSPLHHHFELKGWPEPKVIVRFWIITFILVLFGLATLKLR